MPKIDELVPVLTTFTKVAMPIDIIQSLIFREELVDQFRVTQRFIATQGGLTRWQHISKDINVEASYVQYFLPSALLVNSQFIRSS